MDSSNNPSFVLHSPGKTTFEARPATAISHRHNVLVQIASTGICGSDVHYYKHGRIGSYEVKDPMVLGHESAGIVVSIGSAVTRVRVGDRVALEPGVPCRHCNYCQHGRYNLCRQMAFAATPPINGTLCDVFEIPQDLCYLLPDSLSLDHGAMAEPLSVAVHTIGARAGVSTGDSVVVLGVGPIGLLCCAVARAFGATKIVAVDVNKARLDFAKDYAATDAFDATSLTGTSVEETAEALARQTQLPRGEADIAVDASGVESSIRLGIHLVKPGGTFVQTGMGQGNVSFPIAIACGKELNVRGSFRYGPGDYSTAIQLMASGRVDVKPLITRILPFERAEEAFVETGSDENIKTIIKGPSFTVEG